MTRGTLGLLMTLALGCLWSSLTGAMPAPTNVPRIGLLLSGRPPVSTPLLDAFRQGLREFGWVLGHNLAIEYRLAGEQPDRLPELAADLVRLPVDILITADPFGAGAAQQATSTLPIVVLGVGDAVGRGLVKSLARPGGNITGLSEQYAEISHKWLELLKEAVPQASRVGALTLPRWWPVQGEAWTALQQTATTMRVTLQRVEVQDPSDFERAFARMAEEHVDALVMLSHPMFFEHRRRLVALAAKR
jgi:putative ABC transport system substrate-binding protein